MQMVFKKQSTFMQILMAAICLLIMIVKSRLMLPMQHLLFLIPSLFHLKTF
ncbi:MAG: hypothetical protein RL122_1565 [Pseudomonadota bacterium]|jgi:hypothetical protein